MTVKEHAETTELPIPLIKISALTKGLGLSRTTIYRKMKAGNFPRPIKTGSKSVAWVASEIQGWQQARLDERDAVFANKG